MIVGSNVIQLADKEIIEEVARESHRCLDITNRIKVTDLKGAFSKEYFRLKLDVQFKLNGKNKSLVINTTATPLFEYNTGIQKVKAEVSLYINTQKE